MIKYCPSLFFFFALQNYSTFSFSTNILFHFVQIFCCAMCIYLYVLSSSVARKTISQIPRREALLYLTCGILCTHTHHLLLLLKFFKLSFFKVLKMIFVNGKILRTPSIKTFLQKNSFQDSLPISWKAWARANRQKHNIWKIFEKVP